ncbi:hypothetical protein [Micromonospora echinofusca]|uniref:Uncharacterized protein n=1 Tax=Micromonospora echinofusca TaxID=47858 RepID=A0ABS3VMB9_MICEH|nr:hypothetical protein [Micromonospora echinofusca]MBO4205662.1 hypothetical protein [Micromonospora echinofusca]
MPVGGDPRRLLSDVRTLAHRVRVDQRMTWVALLALVAVTFAGIPFDWFGMTVNCQPDGSCQFARRGLLYYWLPALLLAYTVIAFLPWIFRPSGRRGNGASAEQGRTRRSAATADRRPPAWHREAHRPAR